MSAALLRQGLLAENVMHFGRLLRAAGCPSVPTVCSMLSRPCEFPAWKGVTISIGRWPRCFSTAMTGSPCSTRHFACSGAIPI
jgi:hypothetical protein